MKYVSKILVIAALGSIPAMGEEPSVEPSKEQMALGQQNYVTCLACHGIDGKGMAAGPMKMGPSFAESKLLQADDEIAIAIVLKGIGTGNIESIEDLIDAGYKVTFDA